MKITKEEFEELYYNNTNKFTCKKLKISEFTLLNYVKQLGIKPKGRGNKKGRTKLTIIQ